MKKTLINIFIISLIFFLSFLTYLKTQDIIISFNKIEKIFVNGKTAEKFYNQYIKGKILKEAICLPSTSPANAKWTLDGLILEWRKYLIDFEN